MPIGNQPDLKNRYGNSKVGDLNGKLTAEIKYGDLRTEAIGNDADLTDGSLPVAALGKGFTGVNVVGLHTNIEINMERGTASRFDVAGDYTNLHRLSGVVIRTQAKSGNHESKVGYIGDANARGLVKTRLNYGDLRVK